MTARAAIDPLAYLTCGAPAAEQRARFAHASGAISFVDFCEHIGVTLEPGQRVAALVAYDGIEPEDLEGDDRAIAREMFGDIDRIEPNARRIVVAVCGARGGKTYVLVALRILHLALTVPLDTLAPGEVASAPIIAPDKDLAEQALNYVKGAIDSDPDLRASVLSRGAEHIELRREDGRSVEIVVKAASARGRTGRGRSLVAAAMEEAAFFRDATFQVNDDEIYKALSPRILPGGQLIVDSTPWAQVGLVYDLFAANHPNPERAGLHVPAQTLGTALALHASTLRLRDVELTRTIVASERARDPENAAREYDALFMVAGTATFFDAASIAACIDDRPLPHAPEPGDEVTSGADLGFAKNSSALYIAHRRGGVAWPGALIEKKPQEGALLKPSAVVMEFADEIVRHHGSYLMADGHYKATAIEHLTPVGIGFVDAPTSPAEAFIAVRTAMREGRVRIPNEPRLIRQLRETMGRKGAGGSVTIVLPKWRTGEHGDLVSAFVLAVYQAVGERVPIAGPAPGTREWDLAQADASRERRRRAGQEAASGNWWNRKTRNPFDK